MSKLDMKTALVGGLKRGNLRKEMDHEIET